MMLNPSYRKPFIASVLFHIIILFSLMFELSTSHPVKINDRQNAPGLRLPEAKQDVPPQEIIKAVSIDKAEVLTEMNRLKQVKAHEQQLEVNRQNALKKQAEQLKQQRILEQQRIAKMKQEAEKIAIARKKQLEEEQKRLKKLALEKEQEAKHLAELKRQQNELEKQKKIEADKLELLKKQQAEEKVRLEKERVSQEKALQALKDKQAKEQALAAEKSRQEAAARQQARMEAEARARLSGEVDKYKALIQEAISRQWILPENANRNLSSVFHIRLAPDGAVLEVSLIRSSGDPILDRSAQTAIYKASPLPIPQDATMFNIFRDINLTVRPENIRG